MRLVLLLLGIATAWADIAGSWIIIGNDTLSTNYPVGMIIPVQRDTITINGRALPLSTVTYGYTARRTAPVRERIDIVARSPFLMLYPHTHTAAQTNGNAVRLYPYAPGAVDEQALIAKLTVAVQSGCRELLASCFAETNTSSLYRAIAPRLPHYRSAAKHGFELRNPVSFTQEGKRKGMLFYSRNDHLEAVFIIIQGRHYFG